MGRVGTEDPLQQHLILAGGGHSHALLLRRWAMEGHPRGVLITLVSRASTALYSGMVPGLIAGLYGRRETAIDLRRLCDRAGVRFVRAEIGSVLGDLRRGGEPRQAVATSKTLRQLARITGAAPSGEGPYVRRQLAREDLRAWVPKLAAMTVAERGRLPAVSQARAPQLLAGAVVAEAAMDLLDLPTLELCPWALREGVILQRLDALPDS